MPKVMLNYIQNGRRRLGRPWKRVLDEITTGLFSLVTDVDDDYDDYDDYDF
jgi:hypothetical protein